MRRYWTLFVISTLVVTLLVPAVSFAGGRYGGHGGHRGGGHHIGLGEILVGAFVLGATQAVIQSVRDPYPPVYYQPEPVCLQREPIYRERYDYRTDEYYSVRVGWREVAVPCR